MSLQIGQFTDVLIPVIDGVSGVVDNYAYCLQKNM